MRANEQDAYQRRNWHFVSTSLEYTNRQRSRSNANPQQTARNGSENYRQPPKASKDLAKDLPNDQKPQRPNASNNGCNEGHLDLRASRITNGVRPPILIQRFAHDLFNFNGKSI